MRLSACPVPCVGYMQEMIEANVARGSRVYEDGHVLVLGWACRWGAGREG